MKNTLIISITFFTSILGYGVEVDSIRLKQIEKELEELQEQFHELLVEQARPSANPSILGDVYFASFDILYWYGRANGTAFAYGNTSSQANVPLKGHTKDINFDWEWGLRAGVGKNLDHDRWDLYGTFTLYSPHFSRQCQAGPTNTLIPLKGATLINENVTHAKSSYSLDTYQIDLELGRHYFVSSKLSFRPFVGIKNAWINQRQIVRYTGGSIGNHTSYIEDNCDYWGMGLRVGVNSKWHLGGGFYFNGLLANALIYGYFDIDHREKLTINPYDSIKLDDNKHRFIPAAEWRIGLGYGSYFNERRYFLDVSMSYEGQYFWRLNQMINIYEYRAYRYDNFSDDISMHGITFSVRFHF